MRMVHRILPRRTLSRRSLANSIWPSGGSPDWSARVCHETSEHEDGNGRDTEDARSLLRPPFDGVLAARDRCQTSQCGYHPERPDEPAHDAESSARTRCRRDGDQDETKGDSNDREDEETRCSRRDEFTGNPHEAGRHEDADRANGAYEKAEDESRGFHESSSGSPRRRRVGAPSQKHMCGTLARRVRRALIAQSPHVDVLEEMFAGPEQDGADRQVQLVDESGAQILPDRRYAA